MSDEMKPEPLTLTIVIEYEDGDYYGRIAGSSIYADGKTPDEAVRSVVAAWLAVQAMHAEGPYRQAAVLAKDEQREKNAEFLEQANAGYAEARKREKKGHSYIVETTTSGRAQAAKTPRRSSRN